MKQIMQTDRLRLRPIDPVQDKLPLVELINDYEVSKWLARVKYPYGVEDFDEFVAYANENPV